MVHWNTPCDGLGLRLSVADVHGLHVQASTPAFGYTTELQVDDYVVAIGSAIVERGDWTFAAEYARINGTGEITTSFGLRQPYVDASDSGYISSTWHMKPWLEWYAALEGSWPSLGDRNGNYLYTAVFATDLMPTHRWSLKAEFRDNWQSASTSEDTHYQILALKTTVDF